MWEGKGGGRGRRWGLIYAGNDAADSNQTRQASWPGRGRLARARSRSGHSRSDPVQTRVGWFPLLSSPSLSVSRSAEFHSHSTSVVIRFASPSFHLTYSIPCDVQQVSIFAASLPFPVDLPLGFYLCLACAYLNRIYLFFLYLSNPSVSSDPSRASLFLDPQHGSGPPCVDSCQFFEHPRCRRDVHLSLSAKRPSHRSR